MRSTLLGALLLTAAMWAPSTSHAIPIDEPFEGDRSSLLEIHAGLPYIGYFGVAPGIRYGIPIVDNGFVPVIDNSVYINFGADVYLVNRWNFVDNNGFGVGVGIPVALQWNFYFTQDWSAYGEVGVNAVFFPGQNFGLGFTSNFVIAAVGGRYHFSDRSALTARVGSPYASLGIAFSL